MRTGTENKGTATKEAAGGVGRCTTWNTTTHKHTIRHTSTNTQGCFIHAPLSYTRSIFSQSQADEGSFVGCLVGELVGTMLPGKAAGAADTWPCGDAWLDKYRSHPAEHTPH